MKNRSTSLYSFIIATFFLCNFSANAQWQQKGDDIAGAEGYGIGTSVSLSADGNRMAIGSPNADPNGSGSGQVQIYSFVGNDWVQLGANINGTSANEKLGHSVSLTPDGNRIAIGTTFITTANGNFTGQVTVMDWNGSAWEMVGNPINGLFNGDNFGWSVSISSNGNRVAVSAPLSGPSGTHLGQVSVFELNGSNWVQMGTGINGQETDDYVGFSIKLSGDGNRVAMGAHLNDNAAADAGNVRIFEWNGNEWLQMGETINGTEETDWFGNSIGFSEDGNRIAASAWHHGNDRGEIRVFDWNGAAWIQVGQSISGENDFDNGGWSMALSADGSTIAMGSTQNPGGGEYRGQTRIFKLVNNVWLQVDNGITGSMDFDFFGYYTALSATGETVAVGSPLSSAAGNFSGVVRVFEGGVLDVNAQKDLNEFVISPIPATDFVKIHMKKSFSQIQVVQYDVLGKELNNGTFQNLNQVHFSLNGPAGIYFLVIHADNAHKTIKVVKN